MKSKRPGDPGEASAQKGEAGETADLLREVRQGGGRKASAAFQSLQRKYMPLLSAQVDSFRQDPVFAACEREDLLQEAAIVLLLAARSYDGSQSKVTFGLYLKICLRNALVSKLRHLRSEKRRQARTALRFSEVEETAIFSEKEAFSAVFFQKEQDDEESERALFLERFDETAAVRRLAKLFRLPAQERAGRGGSESAGPEPEGEKKKRPPGGVPYLPSEPPLRMLETELLPLLTAYEREVFRRFYSGQSYKAIAAALSRSEKSVDNALGRIRGKWRRFLRARAEFGAGGRD